MSRFPAWIVTAAALLLGSVAAHAAPVNSPCTQSGPGASRCDPVNQANPLPVAPQSYPTGATPVTSSASAVATLAAAAAKTTYICGFSVDSNATAATSGTASITNTMSGTMNFVQGVAALPAVATLSRTFTPCIPANAQNTAISVGGATGAGGGATTVNAWGYQQ